MLKPGAGGSTASGRRPMRRLEPPVVDLLPAACPLGTPDGLTPHLDGGAEGTEETGDDRRRDPGP